MVVELPQRSVEFEFLLGEEGQLGEIATLFGVADEAAQFALPMFDGALLDLLHAARGLGLVGRADLGQQRLRQHCALGRILHCVHGVGGLAHGQRLECRE